jgi:hypothetical protein
MGPKELLELLEKGGKDVEHFFVRMTGMSIFGNFESTHI